MLEVVSNIAALITGLGAAWIVWLGHRLARRQRADAWLNQFNELHQRFWDDLDFRQVREWFASDRAYEELRATLETRFLDPANLTSEQYKRLEALDKFVNFLMRVRLVDSHLEAPQNLWVDLSFSYWVDVINLRRRWHVAYYLEHFFGDRSSLRAVLSEPADPQMRSEFAEIKRRLSRGTAESN